KTRKNLCCRKHNINAQPEKSDTRTSLQIAGRNVRCRMQRQGHHVKKSISAVVYEAHGNPMEVLRVETRPWPKPEPDEVVVQMRAPPINPADLNAIEGKYPIRPSLPATPGFEGAGTVV